ncbi:DUF6404 family protein [Rhodoferax lithotrophicus]|uniref:DUF6404 family protein n=1 Tax=Rhodoferax lithotrophicus TaxID=2798804 RepID=UPI00338F671C
MQAGQPITLRNAKLNISLDAGLAGLCFGFFMAIYYAIGRKKHQLPLWKDLSASAKT